VPGTITSQGAGAAAARARGAGAATRHGSVAASAGALLLGVQPHRLRYGV
jgi:hypothetical protein